MATSINTSQRGFFANSFDAFYKSAADFGFTKYFIFNIKAGYDAGVLEQRNVVFEVPEGVYVITQIREIAQTLDTLSESRDMKFEKLKNESQLLAITSKYREPINLFGNEKLVRWKVGF